MKKFIVFFVLIVFAIFAGGIFGKTLQSEDTRLAETTEKIVVADTPGTSRRPASPTSVPLLKPAALGIPKLGIQAPVEYVGMDAKGNMDVPKDDSHVAWYQLGFYPGAAGNAVIAGHFDRKDGGPAIFFELNKLVAGDEITVTDQNAKLLTFVVVGKNRYPVHNFPIPTVFGPSDKKYLNLVTCGGVWDSAKKIYSDRLVVRAELKE